MHSLKKLLFLSLFFGQIALADFAHPYFENGSFEGLDLVSGKTLKIDFTQAKKAVVILFLSSVCPCSADHQPYLEELAQKYSKKGFIFVAFNSNANEDLDRVSKYFQKDHSHLSFPVLRDENSAIAKKFEAKKTPHAYILNPEGKIIFRGGVTDRTSLKAAKYHYLKDALEEIDTDRPLSRTDVRVLGCEIRRK